MTRHKLVGSWDVKAEGLQVQSRSRDGEMAQRVKALACEPDSPEFNPKDAYDEGKDLTPASCPLCSTRLAPACPTTMHAQTEREIDKSHHNQPHPHSKNLPEKQTLMKDGDGQDRHLTGSDI